MKLKSIATASGQNIELNKFVVLVGPHNSGKSQSLRDILVSIIAGPGAERIVVRSITFEKPVSFDELIRGIDFIPNPGRPEQVTARGLGQNLSGQESTAFDLAGLRKQYDDFSDGAFISGGLGRFRALFLDTASRLTLGQATGSHDPSREAPSTPLQALFAAGVPTETELRSIFKRIFSMDIKLDWSQMKNLCLRVAREFSDIPPDPREAGPIMQRFSQIETQGDGFRSFVGIAMGLLLSAGRIVLVDEPEAFLHPAHARRLGSWIAERMDRSSDQIIIATHSADILAGILSRNPREVTILRVDRRDNQTTFKPITAELTARLAIHPVLSSQRVIESVFYGGVVVCEADADRSVYEAVAIKQHDDLDVLFIHAHNKQTIRTVVGPLRQTHVPVACITDIDILNSHDELRALLVASGPERDFSDILDKRRRLAEAVEGRSDEEVLREISEQVDEFLNQLKKGAHTLSGARSAIDRVASGGTRWSLAKRNGISGLPAAVRELAMTIIDRAKQFGMFVVPVGELEGWMELGVRQKNLWVTRALEEIDAGRCDTRLVAFVEEILRFLSLGTWADIAKAIRFQMFPMFPFIQLSSIRK